MGFSKLVNLFALSSLAIIVSNLGIAPVNALSLDSHGMLNAKRTHGHDFVAKRKRGSPSSRCKTRPASTASSSSTESPAPSSSSAWTPPPSSSSSSTPAPSSSSPSPSPSPSSGGGGGKGKVGLAWTNGNNGFSNFVTDRVGYTYSWTPEGPSDASSLGVKFIPMLWSDAPDRVADFQSKVVKGYAEYVLAFNEVDQTGQANMNVEQGLAAWWKYIEPLKDQGYSLLSPVTSSAPAGLSWMKQFVSECNGCHIHGITVHYYGTDPQAMIAYIESFYAAFELPIWVTEFACQNFDTANENNGQQCSESQVWNFYKTVINYMENSDHVEAYFPFGALTSMSGVNQLDSLMNSDMTPTALGLAVINVNFP
ncbi:hypothetical protein EW145_g2277 [Phellinidium pouzarii]|uniref:Asl1-like glycosyl hydrolase catalytic domain-containing protein n=1 Tax=Phellinidium pouzarii TaxID=167371 RepID=A0A4S4LBN6_9AGAM|nr:hypothetical protein EW145_g2277 [Phellinidium pouzarii]